MILIEVYTENPIALNQRLTYTYDQFIEMGCRVLVELQKQKVVAFVHKSYEGEPAFEVKPILEVIDEDPIINDELLELAHHMSYETVSPLIRCLQAILPNPLRPKRKTHSIVMTRMIKVKDTSIAMTSHQQSIVDDLNKQSDMTYSDGLKKYKSSLRSLITKGVIEEYEIEKSYKAKNLSITSNDKALTPDQQSAFDAIQLYQSKTYLLFGATGSGKTEIYLQVAKKVIDEGRQVLILVPEISLTPQMIERFQSRFGQDIGIYHSGLNDQEKYEQHQRVKNNEVNIVVGTRSCVFLPYSNLGLIVLDEEHDPSFKQESIPYYHARDIALIRSKTHNCPLILGSASPSLDSYARALKGVYELLTLPNRINESFPDVKVVDMRSQLRQLKNDILSAELRQAMDETLQKNQQIILLLNRRSYSPIVVCQQCMNPLECPHCDTTLAYHKDTQSYICHTCGYSQSSNTCNHCGHKATIMKGLGTQRLQEVVQAQFPHAIVERMDADTTRRKNAHFDLLNRFQNHDIDILVGTQMIAKGLDMPNVTLVGILNADAALMHDDFSSTEKAFSLILQASGRAGRHDLKGHVYVQSFYPSHYAIDYALRQDYIGFFNQEMRYRHQGQYPPYSYLAQIVLSHKNEKMIDDLSFKIAQKLKEKKLLVLGPVNIRKLSNLNRGRIVIKSKNKEEMIKTIHEVYEELQVMKSNVKVVTNINPLHLSL